MFRSRPKSALVAATAGFVLLTLAIGCRGFFVNQPNSVTVTTGANGTGSSTFNVAQGATVKLFATASYSSGNKDVSNSAAWQSSTPCATVTAGLVKGIGAATNVTITATVAGVSGSATGTVTGSGGQGLTITPPGPFTLATTPTVQFLASQNGTDVTGNSTWTSSNTSVLTFSSTTPGLASLVTTGTSTVTASLSSGNSCASGSLTVTVQ
ncbi:MAG TPA: hypothetical protein VFB00_03130 [Terriglobales bacterium]|nr:hypothetical protein [Terriglobales bacterium]